MTQASTKAPPPAPTAAQAIVPSRPGAPAIPIPLNPVDVDRLRERVSELADQRSAVNRQRSQLALQLRSARNGPDATGLEHHIAQLDARVLTIESDIADLGRALAAAPNGLTETTTTAPAAHYGQFNSGQLTAISIVSILFVGMPLAVAVLRIAFRRAARPAAAHFPKEVSDRLERMEQGIEAVALEVERIGEGQRFVTQLMADRAQRATLPAPVPRA